MDGNRRWGKQTYSDPLQARTIFKRVVFLNCSFRLPFLSQFNTKQGHWTGGQKLIDFVQWCIQDGIEILTVYAFSSENWNRDPLEISMLMDILMKYVQDLKKEALKKDIKVM